MKIQRGEKTGSADFPFVKLPLQFFFPAAEQGVQQGVKLRAVVLVVEVAQFVEDDVVLQVLRKENQAHVEVDIALRGA